MKKLFISLLLSILCITSLSPVTASITVPERTSNTTWVEDYANVLTPSTEQYIQQYSQQLADEHSACIVVVTVDFVQGSIDDYALSIFNQWKIGDKSLNNGVLLLLSVGDEDYYMMIGRGLEDDFPIYDIQNLLDDYLEPDFAVGDYDSGVMSVYRETYDYMQNNIYGNQGSGSTDYDDSNDAFYTFMGILFIILAFIFILSIIRAIRRSRRYYTPYTYYTRPRYRTYHSPFSSRPSHYNGWDRPSSYHSSSGSGYSGSSSSSHSSSSHSSHSSFGSGSSFGGSSRGAGAGRRK